MPAILSRFSTLLLRDLDNTKILLKKLFVRYLVVKPARVCKRSSRFQETKK